MLFASCAQFSVKEATSKKLVTFLSFHFSLNAFNVLRSRVIELTRSKHHPSQLLSSLRCLHCLSGLTPSTPYLSHMVQPHRKSISQLWLRMMTTCSLPNLSTVACSLYSVHSVPDHHSNSITSSVKKAVEKCVKQVLKRQMRQDDLDCDKRHCKLLNQLLLLI